jgi:hypothetical protein
VVPITSRRTPVGPVELAPRPLSIDPATPPAEPAPEPIIQVTLGRVVPVAARPAPVRPVEAAPRPLSIDPATSPPESPPEPSIQVTIGRIEVRATPPPRPSREPARAPVLGLDDYMRRRNGERP